MTFVIDNKTGKLMSYGAYIESKQKKLNKLKGIDKNEILEKINDLKQQINNLELLIK